PPGARRRFLAWGRLHQDARVGGLWRLALRPGELTSSRPGGSRPRRPHRGGSRPRVKPDRDRTGQWFSGGRWGRPDAPPSRQQLELTRRAARVLAALLGVPRSRRAGFAARGSARERARRIRPDREPPSLPVGEL